MMKAVGYKKSLPIEDPDPVTSKMDRDYSAAQQALGNALGNENAWSSAEINSHAASHVNSAANGWPDNRTGSIEGCTGCHQGAHDTHYGR